MWRNIVEIGKTAASFLQTGKFPPNTPPNLKHLLAKQNHLASRKFFMTFVAVGILIFFYFTSVFILFLLPAEYVAHITAFTTIFSKIVEILAVVIGLFLGAQAAVDLRYSSSSNTSIEHQSQAQAIQENVNIQEEQTHRIIREGEKNAPLIRPFSMFAVDEF